MATKFIASSFRRPRFNICQLKKKIKLLSLTKKLRQQKYFLQVKILFKRHLLGYLYPLVASLQNITLMKLHLILFFFIWCTFLIKVKHLDPPPKAKRYSPSYFATTYRFLVVTLNDDFYPLHVFFFLSNLDILDLVKFSQNWHLQPRKFAFQI